MSSILKALKKLEDEKVSRRDEPKDIARKILKERQASTRLPWIPLIGGMVAVAALAVLATYAAMGGFARPGGNETQPMVRTSAALKPELTPPAAAPVTLKIVKEPAPVAPGEAKTAHLPVVQQANAAMQQQPAAPSPPGASESLIQSQQGNLHDAVTPPSPLLRVTGIAWQKDSTSRIAIVNGQAVSEGANVGNARVQTIHPDRVEFAHAGQKLTVPLEK